MAGFFLPSIKSCANMCIHKLIEKNTMTNSKININKGETVELYRIMYAFRDDKTAKIIRVLGPDRYKVTEKLVKSVDLGNTMRGNIQYNVDKVRNFEPLDSQIKDTRLFLVTKDKINEAIATAHGEMEKWIERELKSLEEKTKRMNGLMGAVGEGLEIRHGIKDLD